MYPFLAYASTVPPPPATTVEEEPKPGVIMIITFENGTTEAIRSDSTNIQAVDGGYFITDTSVKVSQPLQSKTVSKTILQQLVGVFVDVRIDDPLPLAPPTSSEGCAEGWGYKANDPTPICEPLDKIGEGPPPDMAFCAALGCPYNPPAETKLPAADNGDNNNFATTPVTPTEPTAAEEAQEEPATEPDPGDGNQNGEGGNQNEESDDNGSSGSNEGGSSGEGSEE